METLSLIKAAKRTIYLGDFPYRNSNGIFIWPVEMQKILNQGSHNVIRNYLSELDQLLITKKKIKKEVEELEALLEIIEQQYISEMNNHTSEIPKYEQELALAKEELEEFKEKCEILDIPVNKELIHQEKQDASLSTTVHKKKPILLNYLFEVVILIIGEILLWVTLGSKLMEFKSYNQILARMVIYLVIYILFEIVKSNKNKRFHRNSRRVYLGISILCLVYILVSPIIAIQLGVFEDSSNEVASSLFETTSSISEENSGYSEILFSEFIPLFISIISFMIIGIIPNRKKSDKPSTGKEVHNLETSNNVDGTKEYQKYLGKVTSLKSKISAIKLRIKNSEEKSPKDLIKVQQEFEDLSEKLKKTESDIKELLLTYQNHKSLLYTDLKEFRNTLEHELSNSPQKYGLTKPLSWPEPKDIIHYYKK